MTKLAKLMLALLLLPSLSQAARFSPADFKGGESWTYEITSTSAGVPSPPFQQEYSVLWKTQRGTFMTGQRRALTNNAWEPGKDFAANRCLVFVTDLTFDFGSEFCRGEVPAGQQTQDESEFFKRTVKYEGAAPARSPLGFFSAARFTVTDELKGTGDTTAPTAKQRLWEFWYVPELMAFSRVNLQFQDANGAVVRTLSMNLVATSVRQGAN